MMQAFLDPLILVTVSLTLQKERREEGGAPRGGGGATLMGFLQSWHDVSRLHA